MAATHTRAGSDQLTVGGHGHASFGRIAGEGGGGRHEAVGHQSQEHAVSTLLQPGIFGIADSHTEGRLDWYVVGVKTQAQTVAQTSFLRVEFGYQLRPSPVPPAGQQPGQADTDGVEGRRAEVAGESLPQDGSPRAKVEETDEQVEVVHTLQVIGGLNVVRGQPDVVRATYAGSPGTDVGDGLQA
jgi:hypothetical protein